MKTITIDYDEYKQIIKDKERAEATTEELLKHAATVIIRKTEIRHLIGSYDPFSSYGGGGLGNIAYPEITTENLAKGEVIQALEDQIIILADSNEELKQKLDQLKDEIETIPLVKPRRGWWF